MITPPPRAHRFDPRLPATTMLRLRQLRISEATSIARSVPRLELAQFYFARGLAPEAIGLIRTIEQSDEDLAKRPDVRALLGAANFMLGRYEEAEESMAEPSLKGYSEGGLWPGGDGIGRGHG